MKCLVFDRNDGVHGIGFEIEYGGIKQFAIAWPDRPPERMNGDYLKLNNITLVGEADVTETTTAVVVPPQLEASPDVVTAPMTSDHVTPPVVVSTPTDPTPPVETSTEPVLTPAEVQTPQNNAPTSTQPEASAPPTTPADVDLAQV